MEEKKTYREAVLEKHKLIWLTKEGYDKLRKLKKIEGKSMMQIVDDLIKNYESLWKR